MGHNFKGFNVAHIGAQCGEFEAQGFTEGWTPLHWAVLADNPKAVVWLLKHGADAEIKDFAGRTAKDLVDDHWGELYQRVAQHISAKKREELTEPQKVKDKRLKQMIAAFKQEIVENEFDCVGYKNIKV